VAIELGLREGQVNKFFREYWKLKRIDKLYQLYPEIEPSLPSFLKLHKALKKKGLNPQNTESFVGLIELGIVKLPRTVSAASSIISLYFSLSYWDRYSAWVLSTAIGTTLHFRLSLLLFESSVYYLLI